MEGGTDVGTLFYAYLFYVLKSNIHVPTVLHSKHDVYLSSYNVDATITDADGFVIPDVTIQDDDDDDVTTHSVPKARDPEPQQASSRFFRRNVHHEI